LSARWAFVDDKRLLFGPLALAIGTNGPLGRNRRESHHCRFTQFQQPRVQPGEMNDVQQNQKRLLNKAENAQENVMKRL